MEFMFEIGILLDTLGKEVDYQGSGNEILLTERMT